MIGHLAADSLLNSIDVNRYLKHLSNSCFCLGYGNGPEGVPPPSSGGPSGTPSGMSGGIGPGGPGGLSGSGGSMSGGGPGGMSGPGPQRGGSYNQPSQSQGYHPYRR